MGELRFVYGPMSDQEDFAENVMKEGKFNFVQNLRQRLGIMVCRAISYRSKIPLVFLERNVNAHDYIHNVSEPAAIPYLQLENHIFSQDNDSNIHHQDL